MDLSTASATRRRRLGLLIAGALLLLGVWLGLAVGAVALPWGSVAAELLDRLPFISMESGLTEREAAIVWQLRAPRVVLGGLVGAMLAVAGGAYQGAFRNPLADPYLLGVAAGAGLGATAAIVSGTGTPAWTIAIAAFTGGVLAVVVAWFASKGRGGRTATSLILAGVAVAAFFTSVQTFLQQRAGDQAREVFAWILGRLSTAGWSEVLVLAPYVTAAAVVLLLARRILDVLAVGDDEAAALGTRPQAVRAAVVVAATLGTAAAVSVSGLIGFVGIIVPHTVRLLAGASYRTVLPLAFVGGAAFLILADLVARTALAPGELPIGVVTAFVGAPFFVLVLRSSRMGA